MNMSKALRCVLFILAFLIAPDALTKPTIEDFLKDRDLRTASISPSGRYLAEIWDDNKTRIVTIIDLEAPGKPTVGRLIDKISRADSISWKNDDRLLVKALIPYDTNAVTRASEKKKDFDIDDYFMFSRTFSMDVHAKNIVMLMKDEKSVRDNINLSRIYHYLPKDHDHILMNAFRDEINILYKVNVYTGASEVVTKGSRFTFMFVSDYDGNTRYRFDYRRFAKEIIIYELQDENKWSLVDKIKLNEKENEDGFDPGDLMGLYENELVYRKRNDVTGFLELIKYNSKEKKYETFVSLPDKDVLYPISDLRSNKIVGYAIDGDYIRNHFFDTLTQSYYDTLSEKVGDTNFYFSSYTEDGYKAIVETYSPNDPLSFNLYDFKKDELAFLGNAYSNIATKNLSNAATANYSARDGKKIHSYILLPSDYESGKKYPLIVMPHGGPQLRSRANYDDFAQFISTRGYIVIKPNFRGSTGSGKEFEEAGYKQWGQLMQDDLTDAVNFMIKKGYADPARVCIVGISYGGYAALMGAIKTPELYRCSISINGVTHLRDMIESDAKEVSDDALVEKYWYQRIGNPVTDRIMLDQNSPALHADAVKIPILLIASIEDSIVPFSQAKMMKSALAKNKKEFNFIELKGADHNPFIYKKDMKTVYTEVEKFLEKYFQYPTETK